MPPPLKVNLSALADRQLLEIKQTIEIPQRVRNRAEMIRLKGHGWSVDKIAKYMRNSPHTVRASIHRFTEKGIEGLWEASGRGRKPRWTEADLEYLEQSLSEDKCTYNSQQLRQKLATERGVDLSAARVRRLLKKRGGVGKEPDTNSAHAQSHN